MYKFTNKVLLGVLGFALSSSLAFAIDNEFKNSLMKIELKKIADNAYSIDLYTKHNFSEPVKVIKKSDLNYYILLPETKNETVRTTTNGTEIRNISTNVYPYAGQDVKNGYVKINIDTTKPLEFKVTTKNIEAAIKLPKEATVAQAEVKKEIKEETKNETTSSQKKNFSSTNSKKEQAKQIKKEVVLKPKANIETPKIEDMVQEEVQKAKEQMLQEQLEEVSQDDPIEFEQEERTLSEEELEEISQIAADNQKVKNPKKTTFKQKISNKLFQYGISLREFCLMFGAFFLSFLCMLVFLTKKKPQPKLKSKTDLIEDETVCEQTESAVKNDGQYFVFDKGVKQIGFCDPATSAIKKNYELSSYEPELKNKYSRNINPCNKKFESEYDIIQKILKEDTFIDIPTQNAIQQTQIAPKVEAQKEVQKASEPIKQETKQPPAPQEPIVLSSVEIAPERGFMCVSYNDNISLMGYIFDDVFALYNFKTQKLENYDIKFRLSEKDERLARFIVKVMDTKMLIKVTKSEMIMEVLL